MPHDCGRTERQIVVDTFMRFNPGYDPDSVPRKSNLVAVSHHLHTAAELKGIFGPGSPCCPRGISKPTILDMVARQKQKEIDDRRGRPPAVPEHVLAKVLTVLTMVVSARATIVSAPMLQPIALGVLVAYGYGNLLRNPEQKKKGLFTAGCDWIRALMKSKGWRPCRPAGNTRCALCWNPCSPAPCTLMCTHNPYPNMAGKCLVTDPSSCIGSCFGSPTSSPSTPSPRSLWSMVTTLVCPPPARHLPRTRCPARDATHKMPPEMRPRCARVRCALRS